MALRDWLPFGRGKVVDKIVGHDPRGWEMKVGGWPGRWQKSDELFATPSISDMEASYENPIVHACVDEISTSIPDARLEIGMEIKGEWQALDSHPMLDLVQNPNAEMGFHDYLRKKVMAEELTGIGYTFKVPSKAGRNTVELWPTPTSWVTLKKDSDDPTDIHYEIKGHTRTYAPEDMVIVRHPDPASILRGFAPFLSAMRDYSLDREREQYLAEMLLNLKVPGMTIIKKDGFGNPDKYKQAKKDIRNAIGKNNRGEPLLLEGDVTATMNNPLGDMDWPNLTQLFESRICMSFGVPPIIVGARIGLNRSTFSNYKEARRSFYQETLRPKWKLIAGSFTRCLLRVEGEKRLEFRFRYDELPEFQEDETEKTTRTTAKFTAGLISKKEARLELGYEPEIPKELQDDEEEDTDVQTGVEEETDNEDEAEDDKKKKK